MRVLVSSAVLLLILNVAASAATIAPVSGRISANFGQGFVVIPSARTVPPGTQVMVAPGGEGTINYGSGCVVPVTSGQIYTVAASAPCTAGSNFIGPAVDPTTLVVGGLVAAGAVVGIVIAAQDDDDPPASP